MTRAISLQKLEESEYLLRTNNYRKGLGMDTPGCKMLNRT